MQIARMFLIIFFMLVLKLQTAAGCEAVKWPFDTNIKQASVANFQPIKREFLYSYLYFEISSPVGVRTPGLAQKLFYYLINTELNNDKYNMLQALEIAAELDKEKPNIIPISEICKIEKKISREPSSKKGNKK